MKGKPLAYTLFLALTLIILLVYVLSKRGDTISDISQSINDSDGIVHVVDKVILTFNEN
ncbi:MAG: hypothetical protein H8E55_57525 [Pelagibacterales bacterium]|jgi:hypothetical protein|nr:hypothetical protein [Pelagibacterales bacterium]